MLRLNLAALRKGEVARTTRVAPDAPLWAETGLTFAGPLQVEWSARTVGAGIAVRLTVCGEIAQECRRCLKPASAPLEERLELLFAREIEESATGDGEVYALPPRAQHLDLSEPLREQLLLRAPKYALCDEECSGLCPACGVNRNHDSCACAGAPAPVAGPWDALQNIEFD